METYLSNHKWHFSKKLCECAVKEMVSRATSKIIDPWSKEKVDALLKQHNIEVKKAKEYDTVYVCNMAMADYFGDSIEDNLHLARFVRDYIDDPDGYDGIALTRYYADCIGKGEPIDWESVL